MREPITGRTTLPRRPEAARGPGRVVEEPDLQALLADAVRSLAEATRATAVVAWGRRADGTAAVLAACFEGPGPGPPDPLIHAAISQLRAATDLGAPGLPFGLREAAQRLGFAAAVPVRAGGGEPQALLLLVGPEDRAGRVRPRTLAALDALARRLEIPVGAALARQRLAALDEDVQHLDRLAALGGLVAEIVHEIRNPLVSVKTFLQLLPDRAGDPEFHQSFFEVATEELRRIERLLEVVLEHARPRSSDPEAPAEVSSVIESVARLLAHRAAERGVTLVTEAAPDLPRAAIAEDALRQVVLNLAMNALEASPPGAPVAIRAGVAEGGVEIRVEDRGPGVPQARRALVFEAFVSSKEDRPGGLGLAISRRLAEGAGGRIGVADGEQGGAVFCVWLPAR